MFCWYARKQRGKKVQGLLSAIDIWPLQVLLSLSSTLGWMEQGLPPSDTPAETQDFGMSAPNDILIHGDFSSMPFREAVKSSSESYSAWETALSCLRACGPCQVLEVSEELSHMPKNPQNSATFVNQHGCIFYAASACSKFSYCYQNRENSPKRQEMLFS